MSVAVFNRERAGDDVCRRGRATREEMARVLHLPPTTDDIHNSFAALEKSLTAMAEEIEAGRRALEELRKTRRSDYADNRQPAFRGEELRLSRKLSDFGEEFLQRAA